MPRDQIRTLGGKIKVAADPIKLALRAKCRSYYRLDGNGLDSGPNALHCSDVDGTVAYTTGKIGQGMSLPTNASPYLRRASSPYHSFTTGSFTITCWWKPNAAAIAGNGHIVAKDDGVAREWIIRYNGDLQFFAWYPGNNSIIIFSGVTLTADTWYFIRAWHDWTEHKIKLCVNEGTVYELAFNAGGGIGNLACPLEIGTRYYGKGVTDEVGIFGDLLTADEADRMYAEGAGWSPYP